MSSASLPPSWSEIQLGEIALRVTDGTHQSPSFVSEGVPFLVISNVVSGTIDWDGVRKWVTRETYEECTARCRPERGDVLYTAVGTYGHALAVDTDRPFMFQRHIAHIKPDARVIDARYLARVLNSPELRKYADSVARGAAQKTVTLGELSRFLIPLPPMNEQRRIVAKLESLLARSRRAREALDAIPALLERFRQSVLAAAFRGDLTRDWREKNPDVEPASKLLERIRAERRRRWEEAELERMRARGKPPKDDRWREKYPLPAPLAEVPEEELPPSWGWMSADEVAWETTVGHVGPMKGEYLPTGVPFLRSQNVRENRFDPAELRFVSDAFHKKLAKSALRPGDLVVVRSGAPGTACAIPPSLAEANCSDLVIVRLVPSINAQLLAFYMNSGRARDQVVGMQVGVAQQHFNVGAMRRLAVPVMPQEEQVLVAERVASAFRRASLIESSAEQAWERLTQLDATTLAKAFRGELVPQDPTDEPASVLLERIRAERDASQPSTATPKRRTKKAS